MEGIAKTSVTEPKIEVRHPPFSSISAIPDIPPDVYRFFNLHYGEGDTKTQDILTEISKWALDKTETMGDALMKMKNLEIQLGMPTDGQTRYQKMFNWVTLQRTIDELYKKQEALA